MALQRAYEQFLATSSPSLLADDASLHYITTLTSLHGSAKIGKYLKDQLHELKKKEEKVLDAVESPNALVVEVSTTLEFVTGGGAYLPDLDDNFLADRMVNFPVIHIVTFNTNGQIAQIRQNWDQGSLLKLIDVIGKTGRNWPIRDGKEQIMLIASSVKSSGKSSGATQEEPVRPRGNSGHITGDPHASLSLFAPRQKNPLADQPAVVVNQRSSARPPQRDMGELFVNGDSLSPPSNDSARDRSESPSKFAKAGASKNYAPSRLFDPEEEDENTSHVKPENSPGSKNAYRSNPKRYEHFDMAGGQVEQEFHNEKPLKEVHAKHGSQWKFDDFNTPQKFKPSKVLRTNDVRHWGNSDDEVMDSPIKHKKVEKPRKDAETHFEFLDDGTPDAQRRIASRPRGAGANNGQALYKNNLYDDDNGGEAGGEEFKQSNTIANVKDRRKDFEPHFAMTDKSPLHTPAAGITDNKAKAVKLMDADWDAYDESPHQKENIPASPSRPNASGKGPLSDTTNTGINVAGDGMGGRKGAGQQYGAVPKIYKTGGDGMGGRKGGRQWGFGDESDGEEEGGINNPGKFHASKAQKAKPTGGDFWAF
ncbi:hypothetical protein BJ875DRAFT_63077 [Amylocarpus encephaloides]|uniref:NTF2 domain-containing protein n=1 Tax=Amylocarpus encephaloides TaxID=45428 RepID=A0A9P7YRC1_9HELO|nr:hypothetical protein BJ875DRAFT_63077 [Amylocarpus encephaloides]